MICVYDFCGTGGTVRDTVSMWADYDPTTGLTHFGGLWSGIPARPSSEPPTETECEAWETQHRAAQIAALEQNTHPDAPLFLWAVKNAAFYPQAENPFPS